MVWTEAQIAWANVKINTVLTTMYFSYKNMMDESGKSRYDNEKLQNNMNRIDDAKLSIFGLDPGSIFNCSSPKPSLIDTSVKLSEPELIKAYTVTRKGLEIMVESVTAVQGKYDSGSVIELKEKYHAALSAVMKLNPLPLNNGNK